jgi:hypothetical protein
MSRPSSEFRLPTTVSVAIAVVFAGIGIWLGRSAVGAGEGGATGYEGSMWLLQLLFAGASLLVAAMALYFAESRIVFWVGVVAVIFMMSR